MIMANLVAYLAARCRCDGGYDTHSAALAGDAFDMSLIYCPVSSFQWNLMMVNRVYGSHRPH